MASQPSPLIRYTVSAPEPHTHHLHVEMRVETDPAAAAVPESVDFVMPVWTPGAYQVHDYAGRVHGVEALNAAGRPLEHAKTAKNVWRVRTHGAKVVTLRYRVYAFETQVEKSYLDAERLTINGAGVFLYVDGRKDEPAALILRTPKGWKHVFTGLSRAKTDRDGEGHSFVAADYDELVDCPVMAGNFSAGTFKVRGVPHHAVFVGPGNYDESKLLPDMERTVEAAVGVFDDVPYREYVFFLEMAGGDAGYGGLEHRNSTHMIFPRFKWKPRKDYVAGMGLISHEFFHTWNVKRLRPAGLGPFDYTREVHTPLLWFAEGFTSYYDNLLLRRAGVITPREYLTELGRELRRLAMTPGRSLQSLEESSFDTWIKFYRPHADSHNTTISYYNKGSVFAWMLDMEIRRLAKGRRSLDDAMRLLYRRFHKERDAGITPADIEDACAEVAGRSLKPLFDEVVRGWGDIDYGKYLNYCGLEIAPTGSEGESDEPAAGEPEPKKSAPAGKAAVAMADAGRPYLGMRTRSEGGSVFVNQLLAGGPAHSAGLSVRDEILALNCFRVGPDTLERRLNDLKPGDSATVLVSRSGLVGEVSVTVGPRPPIDFAIRPKSSADAAAKKMCRDWLGADWSKLDRPKAGIDFRPREKVL
jgi:predicted metalloprotease with PDZ domain